MRQDLIVSQSIDINAPISKVWEGLTNPAIIKEWLFGTNTITDWQPGNAIVFQGEYNGQTYRDKGIIQEFVVNKTISYTYWSGFSGLEDTLENYSLVTLTVADNGNNTTNFTWTQKGFGSEEGYQHSLGGMTEFLEKIKSVIEK